MPTKDELIAAAQALAARIGARPLSLAEFRRETGIPNGAVYKNFRSWHELGQAAGFATPAWKRRIPDEELFPAMRDIFLAAGGVVGRVKFERRFQYSANVLVRRFHTYPRALAEFLAWARTNDPGFPHMEELAERVALRPDVAAKPPAPDGPPWPSTGGRPCGEPLRWGPLLHAPVNENGVILAFGMLAERLGYAVESMTYGFPDCLAKRRVGDGRWETVRIEFEYRSYAFREHGHDPKGCDVIVCWKHDWRGCPVEVLELSAAFARLTTAPRRGPSGLRGTPARLRCSHAAALKSPICASNARL